MNQWAMDFGIRIRRVDLVFGISYQDDIATTKAVLNEILTSDARILKDPPPVIAVSALADSSVNLIVRPWVNVDDYWPVYWDITEAVKLRFDQKQITIPHPQRVVRTLPGKAAEIGEACQQATLAACWVSLQSLLNAAENPGPADK